MRRLRATSEIRFHVSVRTRVNQIIHVLLDATDYITASHIAQTLHVSTRTVFREIPYVERLLAKHRLHLERRSGFGLKLTDDEGERLRLTEALHTQRIEKTFTPTDREILIAIRLIEAQSTIKLLELGQLLRVTDSCVSRDLARLTDRFALGGLEVIKRPGYGVELRGSERRRRTMLMSLFFESVDRQCFSERVFHRDGDVLLAMDSTPWNGGERELVRHLYAPHLHAPVVSTLRNVEGVLGYRFTFAGFTTLYVYLSIALKRITEGRTVEEGIDIDDIDRQTLRAAAEAFAALGGVLDEEAVPSGEIAFLALLLHAADIDTPLKSRTAISVAGEHYYDLVRRLIRIVESESGYYLRDDDRIVPALSAYVERMMRRVRHAVPVWYAREEVPHYSEVEFLHPSVCAILAEEARSAVPEAEVYAVLAYFAAALAEKHELNVASIRAIVVCSAGIGSSVYLAHRIQSAFPQVEVVETISAFGVSSERVTDGEIDLVISTYPIPDLSADCVVLSPGFERDDAQRLRVSIDAAQARGGYRRTSSVDSKTPGTEHTDAIIPPILAVLDTFFLLDVDDIERVAAIGERVCEAVGASEAGCHTVIDALEAREALGSIIIGERSIRLVHCKTACVATVRAGVLRSAETSLGYDTCLVLMLPEAAAEPEHAVLAEISSQLVRGHNFAHVLRHGTRSEIISELIHIYHTFLYSKRY